MPHSIASISEKSLIVPGKECPLAVARPAEEEGRGRQVQDARGAELAVHRLQSRDPELGRLGVLLGLLAIVTLQRVLVGFARLGPIAVMGLVVEDEDVLHAHQLRHYTPKHLALGLQSLELLTRLALQQFACALRDLKLLAQPGRRGSW